MDEPWHWFVLQVNPEPWAIGDVAIGRKHGGKIYPYVGRNNQLHSYKEAVREELGDPGLFIDGPVELQFYFWRRRDEYKTPNQSVHRKHEADATNLQKATEDALQDVLFHNDKDVNDVRSVVVEQGPEVIPKVVIGIRKGTKMPVAAGLLPQEVCALLDELEQPGINTPEDNYGEVPF